MVLQLYQPGAGPNGTGVSNSNATSGDQWDTVATTGTGTTQTYDTSQNIHGNASSIKRHMANVASTCHDEWKAKITTSTNNSFVCWYFRQSAAPANTVRLFSFMRGSNLMQSGLNLNTSRFLTLINAVGTGVGTSSGTAVPIGAWCRLEFESTGFSGTTSTLTARLFIGSNIEGSAPDDSISASGVNTQAVVNGARFGAASTSTANADWWYQDMRFNDTVQPGSIVVPDLRRPTLRQIQAVQRSVYY